MQPNRCWNSLKKVPRLLNPDADARQIADVDSCPDELLQYQEQEAMWWRDACVLFFGEYSGMPIPPQYEPPVHSLKYYRTIPFPYDWKGYYGE